MQSAVRRFRGGLFLEKKKKDTIAATKRQKENSFLTLNLDVRGVWERKFNSPYLHGLQGKQGLCRFHSENKTFEKPTYLDIYIHATSLKQNTSPKDNRI